MTRREFPKSVKVARLKKATINGIIYCEFCGVMVKPGGFHFDHARADGLLGEPTFENCYLMCTKCHGEKTKDDVAAIAKAKRREARELGIKDVPKMQSRGFPKSRKVRVEKTTVPRRSLYENSITKEVS